MEKVIGFIGAGNMGQAMGGGLITSGIMKPENIVFSDISNEKLKNALKNWGESHDKKNFI